MAQKAITIYTPPDAAPHIYAEDDAQLYRAIFGRSGITEGDEMLACSLVDNNTVRLASGTFVNQGIFGFAFRRLLRRFDRRERNAKHVSKRFTRR